MDPGWKNLVHKYKTRAVMIELQKLSHSERAIGDSLLVWFYWYVIIPPGGGTPHEKVGNDRPS